MYVQALINHNSDPIVKSEFFEVFRDFRGIDLSKKCMDVSCCIELVSLNLSLLLIYSFIHPTLPFSYIFCFPFLFVFFSTVLFCTSLYSLLPRCVPRLLVINTPLLLLYYLSTAFSTNLFLNALNIAL